MVDKFAIYDRFDQVLDVGINIRMSEIMPCFVIQ